MFTNEHCQLVGVYLCQLGVHRLRKHLPACASTPIGGIAVWRVIVFVDQALVEGYRIFISPYLCREAVVVLVEALLLIRLIGIQPSIVPTRIRDVLFFPSPESCQGRGSLAQGRVRPPS